MKLSFTLLAFFVFSRQKKTPGSSVYQLGLKSPITNAAETILTFFSSSDSKAQDELL